MNDSNCRERLNRVVRNAADLLPAQGPVSAFVFLNSLQAFEDRPFEEAVVEGARLFGCQPYLSEERYRDLLRRGRIQLDDLLAVLRDDLGGHTEQPVASLTNRFELRLAMLKDRQHAAPHAELQWFMAESSALEKLRPEASEKVRKRFIESTRRWAMRDLIDGIQPAEAAQVADAAVLEKISELFSANSETAIEEWDDAAWESFAIQSLWLICQAGCRLNGAETERVRLPSVKMQRHRDVLLQSTGIDSDLLINEVLVRFCAAFLDQGLAQWTLPNRESGFWQAFCSLYRQPQQLRVAWQSGLSTELARLQDAGVSPDEVVAEALRDLGVSESDEVEFIAMSLLALRGWAGMVWQNESRGDRVALPAPVGSLMEFLAARLTLERFALRDVAQRKSSFDGDLSKLRVSKFSSSDLEREAVEPAFVIFQLAQVSGWCPSDLIRLGAADWRQLVCEVVSFCSLERRRMFHLAFERNFRERALLAISVRAGQTSHRPLSPKLQVVTCIDAREESFRRHLEEVAPTTETFSAAGFFGVAMYYRGVADAHFQTLCPIVVKPQHWVVEDVVYTLADEHERKSKARRALGNAALQVHSSSRGSLAGGAVLSAGLGVLASIPLVARVLFPRWTAAMRQRASAFVSPPRITRLRLEREQPTPGPTDGHFGFTVDEKANFAERFLRDIGLTSSFARLVMILGHGSACLNNPHKSVYDCGACSGSAGGPNARTIAAFLQDHRVRSLLLSRGLDIPDETVFLGGQHNTCTDSIEFFDLELLPQSHVADLREAQEVLQRACERNAHERCRRFFSAPLNMTPSAAKRHVEGRAEDLSQTRPEFGNSTNAMCVVGRRSRTRGLYLDRRSFLVSYDPDGDDANSTILARILGAVVVVCSGINLQYLFSYVDPSGWGSGTKLPHNITSLLGVMDGHASDLRMGLPWQGVEIHEPVRLLFVIESTPERVLSIMQRNVTVGRIIRNGWVQLAVLDPNSATLRRYRDGQFEVFQPTSNELPKAASSIDWYRGWRDHLDFAQIETGYEAGFARNLSGTLS